MMRILYLDYDGVLHPDSVYWARGRGVYLKDAPEHELFEHGEILESILATFPDVKIVLSTSWVPALSFSRAKKRLPSGLQARVIGATFHSQYMHRSGFLMLGRGVQVCDDVLRRRPTAWAAIDDADEGWPDAHRHRLVLTDSKLGLGDEGKQQELIQILMQLANK